jgi:para-aminobenzoate synthetase component 1
LGFISYDIGRTVESIAATASDELHWPLLHWTLFRHYLLHDPASRRWTPISLDGDPAGSHELVRRAAAAPCAELPAAGPAVMRRFISAADFKSRVQRARDYIAAGDIYQANIAQRWQIATADAPQDIYRRLCACSPAPYGAFMRFASADGLPRHVLSASPELFLSVDSRRTITRPIKGTRRRNLADPSHDARLRDELLASEKDRAELAMIVDLMRNDLGRVSEFGSVSVDAPRDIEQHPTVWHTVATISALLRRNAGLAELLAAVCPGGSITGAPKIRAMQIIEELESIRRGLYCGNIGVIGPQARTINLNVAIRTLLMQASCAYVHAGGGIVADSDPHLEYDETLAKAAAMLRALGAQSVAP